MTETFPAVHRTSVILFTVQKWGSPALPESLVRGMLHFQTALRSAAPCFVLITIPVVGFVLSDCPPLQKKEKEECVRTESAL